MQKFKETITKYKTTISLLFFVFLVGLLQAYFVGQNSANEVALCGGLIIMAYTLVHGYEIELLKQRQGDVSIIDIPLKTTEGGLIPLYQSQGDAGCDAYARLENPVRVEPGDRVIIPLGISAEIPVGFEVQLRPRSGLAAKNGITLLNAPGTIDAGFRKEWGAIIINHGKEAYTIENEDRICQLVCSKFYEINWKGVNTLSETNRGEGYGSSGKNRKDNIASKSATIIGSPNSSIVVQ